MKESLIKEGMKQFSNDKILEGLSKINTDIMHTINNQPINVTKLSARTSLTGMSHFDNDV